MFYLFNIKKLNNLNNFVNILNYNLVLSIFLKTNIFILNDYSNLKYNWSESYNYDDDVQINFIFCKLNYNSYNLFIENYTYDEDIYQKLILKKKTSIIKKTFDTNYIILNRINSYKNNFNTSFFKTDEDRDNENFFYNNNKNIDLKRKIKLTLKNNRAAVNKFFNFKYYRNFSISKNLKKFCNQSSKNYLFNLQNNLINIIMKTDFFFSKNDCLWFLKNGMISVNSKIVKTHNYMIKPNDIIHIINSEYYFMFYKNNLNNLLNSIYKINLKLWSINKNRYNNIEKKDIKENYPKWIENYKYFKKDIPLYLEVDYVSMSIFFLSYNFDFKNLDFYDFKIFSLYMSRSYNWKFIV